jgi:hypothetical protein
MDISSLRPLEEVEVKITHPVTREETDIVFIVSGTDSKAYRQAVRDVMVRRMANTDAPTSELEDDEIEILAHCTKGFRGLTIDGKEPEQSLDGFILIYTEFSWIKEQVDKFIGKKSNFFLKPQKTTTLTSGN